MLLCTLDFFSYFMHTMLLLIEIWINTQNWHYEFCHKHLLCCQVKEFTKRSQPWGLKGRPRCTMLLSCYTPKVKRLRFSQTAVSPSVTWFFHNDLVNSQYELWTLMPHTLYPVSFGVHQGILSKKLHLH